MQSGYQVDTTSINLCMATECHTGICVDHLTKPDTRRFGTIFPLEVPDAVSFDSSATTQEEQNDSDDLSRFNFVATNTSTTQITSPASTHEGSTLSAAQQVIARYHSVHGSDHTPKYDSTEIEEKVLPQIPDHRCSMYTLVTATNTQSTMDMTWRPQPKVHMRCVDQRALMQAQTQAIAMMHNAGLKPTDKIQCRRRGCADILPSVEALKYHLHIHNIADSTARRRDGPPSAARKPPSVGCNISNPEALKRNHSRLKSSVGTQRECATISPPPRKLSAGSLLPSLFSRESSPVVPSFTTVAKALTPDPSPNKLAGSFPVRKGETPFSPTPTPFRGRRQRKESMTVSVVTPCSQSITMLFSPPSSPTMHDCSVLAPRINLPKPVTLEPTKDMAIENCIYIPKGSAQPVSQPHTKSRSPTRALSPIRNGIRRILSIGSLDNDHDK